MIISYQDYFQYNSFVNNFLPSLSIVKLLYISCRIWWRCKGWLPSFV